MIRILFLSICLVLVACAEKTPESEIDTTIAKMITLIEQGKNQELLAKYVDFSDAKGPVTDISADKLKELRFYLLRAQEMDPVLSENNSLAVFEGQSFKRPLRFKKIEGKWLLKNK